MPNPSQPFLVLLTATNSSGTTEANVEVKFTSSQDTSGIELTDSLGRVIYDLANIGWTSGETITIISAGRFNNEISIDTFIPIVGMATVNISLSQRTKFSGVATGYKTPSIIHTVGDNPVTMDNPFPSAILGFNGTSWRDVELDEITRALAFISYAHHEIHEACHYFIRDFVDLGNGVTRDMLLITPNTDKKAHLILEIDHELEGSVHFYEEPTTSANGTAITTINRYRDSSNASELKVFHTPTVGAVGTLIEQDQKGSGKKFGSSGRDAEEIVLKRNTKYLLRMTNQTANNNLFNWTIDWYEHQNKEA